MERRADGHTDRYMDRPSDKQTGQEDRKVPCMAGLDRLVNGQTDGWMGSWIDRSAYRWITM